MSRDRSPSWTLDELSDEVARRLAELGLLEAQADGRVSAVPDARTVRYYTTLGILDRPSIAGRQARYGTRHVLQLLAIKALQGASLPLGEIQARLYGRSDAELEATLAAAGAATRAERGADGFRPIRWREVTIEPGLKILAEEGWTPGRSRDALEARVRAALEQLGKTTEEAGTPRSLEKGPRGPNGRSDP